MSLMPVPVLAPGLVPVPVLVLVLALAPVLVLVLALAPVLVLVLALAPVLILVLVLVLVLAPVLVLVLVLVPLLPLGHFLLSYQQSRRFHQRKCYAGAIGTGTKADGIPVCNNIKSADRRIKIANHDWY